MASHLLLADAPLVVVFDTTPLGLVTQRPGVAEADACKQWLVSLLSDGARAIVPEIADYELRRELLRAGKTAGIARLNSFNAAETDRYLPLSTPMLREAASLWAEARTRGVPTAAVDALDGDVIIAAQARSLEANGKRIIVATSNPGHLSRFVSAARWQEIRL